MAIRICGVRFCPNDGESKAKGNGQLNGNLDYSPLEVSMH